MARLALVIITLNEEKNIERCIKSVEPLADEIIVVDSGSQDRTVQIAQDMGAKVIFRPFDNHISQKNFAFSCATAEWILSLDADEALSDELKESLEKAIQNPNFQGYTFNRLTNYCGRWIRHSGWYPDRKLRLVRNGMAFWTGRNPHDRLALITQQPIGHLKGDLLHYSYYSLEDHLRQMIRFTNISAEELFKEGIKTNLYHLTLKPWLKFIRHYFLRLGFLDGFEGFLIARLSAYGQFLKYARLRELQKKKQS
ncbi:MAG: glycosyltransferase family 2 protein [Bacteroidales bacterium]